MKPASHIGQGLVFKGDIEQRGNMELSGHVVGRVKLHDSADCLHIHEGAVINGEALAGAVEIHGTVDATVTASRVAIHPTASTRGSIHYEHIQMLGGDNEVTLKRNLIQQP